MGQELFARVAAVPCLCRKNHSKADRAPRHYDGKMFHLDGCMDLNSSFVDKTINTTVYSKTLIKGLLLLSEGVADSSVLLSTTLQ